MGEAALPLDHPLNAVRVPPLYEITSERFQFNILLKYSYDAYNIHMMPLICSIFYAHNHYKQENNPESILSLAKGWWRTNIAAEAPADSPLNEY